MKIIYHVSFFIIIIFLCRVSSNAQQVNKEPAEASLDSLLNIKVSTASKYWQTSSEAPASVTIITAAQIERYGYRTLDDVLRSVRGFYVSNDRNYSYVGVRGFSRPTDYNDRLLLLIDGHTTNENVYGSASVGSDMPIDLSSLDRIEIIRGPGSALYGTGAMFAVVNLIPRKGKDVDGVTVSTDLGSYGRIGGSVLFGKEYNGDLDILFSAQGQNIRGQDLYYPEFNNSSNNYGIARGIDWEDYGAFLTSIKYKSLTLQGVYTSRTKSVPTGAFGTIFNEPGFQTLDQRGYVELKYEQALALDKNFFIRGYYDYYNYEGTYPYPSVLDYDGSLGKWFGTEAQFRWDVFTGNRFTVGGEFKDNPQADYRNWTIDTVYFNKNFPFNAYSLYAQDEYQVLDNLDVMAGVRTDGYSSTRSSTTPRIAIIYNPVRTSTLKFLYGEGFRAPNIYEANYEDALSQWKKSNDLHAEKITTTELVYEQRLSNNLFGVLSLYSYHMNDLIDPVIDSAGVSQFQNISEVNAVGVETEFNYTTDYGLKASLSGSYQKAKDPASDVVLSNSPSYLARLGLSYQVLRELAVGAECIYNSERITVYGTTTDPFFLTQLNVIAKPQVADDASFGGIINHLEVSFLVNNLFNASYATPGGIEHLQPSIPQDGRNVRIKISYSF